MRRIGLVAAVCLLPSIAFAWPWSTDMMNQPSIKAQELADGMTEMAAFPVRSVPIQGFATKVKDREEAKTLTNPIPVTAESLQTGRTLFRVYCATCHGLTGKAEAPVASKIGAIALDNDYVQKTLTEGWIFGTITFGSFVMPAYGVPGGNADRRGSNDLNVEERWHVVNYVRNGLVNEPAVKTASK